MRDEELVGLVPSEGVTPGKVGLPSVQQIWLSGEASRLNIDLGRVSKSAAADRGGRKISGARVRDQT